VRAPEFYGQLEDLRRATATQKGWISFSAATNVGTRSGDIDATRPLCGKRIAAPGKVRIFKSVALPPGEGRHASAHAAGSYASPGNSDAPSSFPFFHC